LIQGSAGGSGLVLLNVPGGGRRRRRGGRSRGFQSGKGGFINFFPNLLLYGNLVAFFRFRIFE
jgi:hypothetical protein